MVEKNLAPILINGAWRPAAAIDSFHAINPATGEDLDDHYPTSHWSDVDEALDSAVAAFIAMQKLEAGKIAAFLRAYADELEANNDDISSTASTETGYGFSPRLRDVEMVRTIGQLRQAADCADDPSWRMPVIDSDNGISSILEPLGPVVVFGPNNFPLAFNAISGGDFAAAIAAGCPVIAKAHRSHPGTCRELAECARKAAADTGMPAGIVQMIYGVDRADGVKLASDPRVGGVGFTGSRSAGESLKAAADKVGKPIFLEMSSVNPVAILPGVLEERGDDVVDELTTSALLGTGQFCTNPGIIFMVAGKETEKAIDDLREKFVDAPVNNLLGEGTEKGLVQAIDTLKKAGAQVITGHEKPRRPGCAWANTLLRATGDQFIGDPHTLQTEAFGNCTLVVVCNDTAQLVDAISHCEGNLTGCIYSAKDGRDDAAYDDVAAVLRPKVGRLLNDKMPTGVAVSPAMNHGGPYPATGHPHFTSVGLPAAMRRFTRLACYDNVRPHRLPAVLQELAGSPA